MDIPEDFLKEQDPIEEIEPEIKTEVSSEPETPKEVVHRKPMQPRLKRVKSVHVRQKNSMTQLYRQNTKYSR